MHHDDSDVTLNVCISSIGGVAAAADPTATLAHSPSVSGGVPSGSRASGSNLSFCGVVGHADHRRFRHTVEHRLGVAVLHLGAQRHGVEDIAGGTRQNLIVWGRSRSQRAESGRRGVRLHPAELPPDERCLSWTHDTDFLVYRELPPAARKRAEEREQMRELLQAVRGVTEAQIAKLPENHQPIVRMLKELQHGSART